MNTCLPFTHFLLSIILFLNTICFFNNEETRFYKNKYPKVPSILTGIWCRLALTKSEESRTSSKARFLWARLVESVTSKTHAMSIRGLWFELACTVALDPSLHTLSQILLTSPTNKEWPWTNTMKTNLYLWGKQSPLYRTRVLQRRWSASSTESYHFIAPSNIWNSKIVSRSIYAAWKIKKTQQLRSELVI